VQESLVGRLLDGRYRVLSHIADGGMASVYLGLDQRLDREVALKVMRAGLARDESFVSRFRREARSAARLSHPNVVAVFDQGEDAGDVFLAMEYVPGRTLREVLQVEGPLTPRAAMDIVDPLLQALDAAHRAGLIHRDVKPENVILRDDGTIKVADFGLARAVTASTTTDQSGVLLGTVAYLSPEQVERGAADARSDVYAAGLVLFEMLTGQQAFSGDSPIHVAYQHVHGSVPMPSSRVGSVPRELDQLVALGTARDPDKRPACAGDYLAEVRRSRALVSAGELDLRPERGTAGHTAGQVGRWGDVGDVGDVGHVRPGTGDGEGNAGSDTMQMLPTKAIPVPQQPSAGSATTHPSGLLVPGRRRRAWPWLLALLTVLIAAGTATAIWYATAGPGAMTTVPTVVGLARADAERIVQAAGLRVGVVESFDEAAPRGSVMASDPGTGTRVRRTSPVGLTVSLGPERYSPPALVGARRDDTAQLLAGSHLLLGTVTETFSESVPAGVVTAQDPGPTASLKRDTRVNVTVSKGRQPLPVQDFTGKPAGAATQSLKDLGLSVVQGDPVNHDTVPSGSVVSQSPSSGTLFRGDTVTLVVSRGPALVPVPDVTLRPAAEARTTLEKAGFQVKVTTLYGGLLQIVRFQNPPVGTMAAKGSTVTISVI